MGLAYRSPSWITTTAAYDGLGRKSSTSLSLDSGAIVTTYAYDGRGRLAYTSLAWSGTPPVECVQSWGATLPTCTPNYGTFTSFDAVNRPTAAIQAGGATTTSQYIADETLITDPAGAAKLQTADRFGNLTAVVEDPSSWYGGPLSGSHVPYSTSYAYDPLSNLTAVTQTGMSTTPQNQWRNRNFSYDTLKRLVKAVNPESGAIYYSYDNSGNPLWRQDALGNLTNTPYDGLNRITAKNYVNNGVTPTVTYSYNDSPSGCAAGNQCARLIAVTAGNASTTYASYDAMGRVTSSTQSLGSLSYGPFSYQYNLAGALWTETYPSGLVVTNSFDAAGRVTQVAGNAGVNYAPSVSYVPQGVNVLTLGNGLTETWSYLTAQKQATGLVASALQPDQSYKVNASWSWGYGTPATDNGNVTSASVYKTDWTGAVYVNATQSFGYDLINRLTSSSESSGSPWTRNFGYDAWGNGWVWSFSGITPSAFTPLGTQTASSNFDSNNRLLIQGSAYNGAGNQTTIGGFTNVYDAENRMVTSAIGGVTTQYTYDGDGRRVQKVTGGTTTNYVYDAGGQLAAEYSSAAAQASACGTCYLTADTLGSTRMITDETATPRECHDYLPFGDEIGRTAGCYAGQTSNTLKFTGKERDAETGLDYFGARYLSSAQGRWTSPDWSTAPQPIPYASLGDPQSLNLYIYLRNGPLGKRDLDGHGDCEKAAGGNNDKWKACKGVAPTLSGGWTISAMPESKGNPVRERIGGVVKGVVTDVFETLRGLGAPDANVDQAERFLDLDPETKNEKFGTQLATLFGLFAGGEDIAGAIAAGHSAVKHLHEFADLGVSTKEALARLIGDVMADTTTETRSLQRGRTAYYDSKRNIIIFHDPNSPDMGTAFRPQNGRSYFDNEIH